MKIFYDNIIFSLQRAGGISLYWSELISASIKKNIDIQFFGSKNENIFQKRIDLNIKTESRISIKILRYMPLLKTLPNGSVFHSSYYRVSFQKNVKNIVTVHDFTYEFFMSGVAKYIHIWQKKIAISKSSGIICVSESTKKDLLKFYPNLKNEKIRVIYNGVGDEFLVLSNPASYLTFQFKNLANRKYLLYVGDRSSYKNFKLAVDVLFGLDDFSLVVIGGGKFNKYEKSIIKERRGDVFHFSGLDGNELNVIYNNACCLLYPSSYEGFGIPIVEAMKSGCPVVSVNVSSIPEVCDNACLLVDNPNLANLIEKVESLEDSEIRKSVIKRGIIRAQAFSWSKCFNDTLKFYEEVENK